MPLLNVVGRSSFNCTIYGHYVPIVLVLLPRKTSFTVTVACGVPYDLSLCERHNSTIDHTTVHINFEVAMHTVFKNVQCTFKTSYN